MLDRDLRPPPSFPRQAPRVAKHHGIVTRTHPGRVLLHRNLHARQAEEPLEQITDGVSGSGADVVRGVRCAGRAEHLVGANGVSHVGDITPCVEVADVQDWLGASGFDLGDLARKTRGDKGW